MNAATDARIYAVSMPCCAVPVFSRVCLKYLYPIYERFLYPCLFFSVYTRKEGYSRRPFQFDLHVFII